MKLESLSRVTQIAAELKVLQGSLDEANAKQLKPQHQVWYGDYTGIKIDSDLLALVIRGQIQRHHEELQKLGVTL